MPWVRRHRRLVPYGWFRTTSVRSHYRRSPYGGSIIPIVVALAVIVLLIVLF
ncbi:hypothetical protein Lesp02_64680 [Lentzea sp. NBRC 105346]|uniref:hypothetical protein n=1 Tax=Lentzea sp. NBRC 105346 TaxID=3032205 RepID=UPI0024A4A3D5|nr:hypothetical protein [Lentzea sp. NBRC 105346]GLZ34281.1 hypothetical protein Lesp02_64680 [Lentzea sp. NBRC 105346]